MRPAVIALGVVAAFAVVRPVAAQPSAQQLMSQQNAAWQQQDIARRQLGETQRAADAARARLQTTAAVKDLEAQRAANLAGAAALDREFDAQMQVQDDLNRQMEADARRLEQLQQADLAAGNALILAVRPAAK
ncbi:hypothetical protein C5708_13795 [Caulobacter sp. CCUG 60055]|uniref:hypothetical protein n=1 Tax=Caulobacter sp. CCUG 60055 TaxID=2100090 RepID=UPI001FA74362|nr:hypothetical protein [Caulobacter sp. CCUG 60055]MBQ1541169.1 hypothetical protein [Caulobacteraceae bacterium]MCI3181325.1 hypothetical protein [Caulobacter sp. CCUG 60055]